MPVKQASKVQEKTERHKTTQDSSKQNIRLILQVYERRKPQHLSVCISGTKLHESITQ
nr:MAG TPA: hypothetical protein [Caudoviricetes sp.]